MEKYLALLRGINVSGKNPMKMEELRVLLSHNKFNNVETYIQSGNIIFEYNKISNVRIAQKISDHIYDGFGYHVPVIVVNFSELSKLIENNPFPNEAKEHADKVMVTFISKKPQLSDIEKFELNNYKSEKYVLEPAHVYLYCSQGYGKAKINNNFLESKLKVRATTRNWKTILKLYELMLKS